MSTARAAKRAKKAREEREEKETRLCLIGFCSNGDRNASDETGKDTAYALVRGHLIEIAEKHVPGITIHSSNCREKCKKQKSNCRYCEFLAIT
jgi:hypothetical protein